MRFNNFLIEGEVDTQPSIPSKISIELKAVRNSINLELVRLKSELLDMQAEFNWRYDTERKGWLPLLSLSWVCKNIKCDSPSGKFELGSDATINLMSNPLNVVATRIHESILSMTGLMSDFESLISFGSPELGLRGLEYGDGFFFSNRALDRPDINVMTKPFSERMNEINDYLTKVFQISSKSKLVWEWHIERERWYPRVAINFDGSEFNLLTFDLDYSYRILMGEDKDVVQGLLAGALKSITSLKV